MLILAEIIKGCKQFPQIFWMQLVIICMLNIAVRVLVAAVSLGAS